MSRRRDVGGDRLSNLPESILTHIPSLMPTKNAVQTSFLSRDWQFKWTSIYNIHIDDSSHSEVGVENACSFVDWILILTCHSKMKSFRLSLVRLNDIYCLTTWIRAVLGKGVQVIEITCCECQGIVLPRCLFSSTSLTKLKLFLPCTLDVNCYDLFPNLKSLHLGGGIVISNRQSPETGILLLSFPVLEVLQLSDCHWSNVTTLKISAPEMILFQNGSQNLDIWNSYVIVISEKKLEKFELCGGLIDNFVLSAPSAYYANLCHFFGKEDDLGPRGFLVLKGLPGLKHLRVTGELVESVMQSRQGLLPIFDKLQRLDIRSFVTFNSLMELLKVLPSLQTLILDMDNGLTADDYDNRLEDLESCPSCIVFHLKDVRLMGILERKTLVHLAIYLLKNAENLEKMLVEVNQKRKTLVEDTLSTCPRRSTCVIVMVNRN